MSYLEEWSECLVHWGVLQAAAVDVRPKHLNEISAQDNDILSKRGQTQLDGAQQVLQQIHRQLTNLVRVYLTYKCDHLEVLHAQGWEFEQVHGHEWHYDVQPIQTHVRCGHDLLSITAV